MVVATEEGAGSKTAVVATAEEAEAGSGGEFVLVTTAEEVGAAGEGPSSEGLGPSFAVHPPATIAIANSTPNSGGHARVEYPTGSTGRIPSIINGSRPGRTPHRVPQRVLWRREDGGYEGTHWVFPPRERF